MSIFTSIFWLVSALLIVASFLPLFSVGTWWIRGCDYPRIPIAILTLSLFLLIPLIFPLEIGYLLLMALLGACLALDTFRIGPYLRFMKKQSQRMEEEKDTKGDCERIGVLSANVFVKNRQTKELERQIQSFEPEIICLVEADKFWTHWAKKFLHLYPHQVREPKKNGYGFVVLSQFEFTDVNVRYITDQNVPSLKSKIKMASDRFVSLYVLHSRPPSPKEGPSDQRDAEMAEVAEEIEAISGPVVVTGDLNDVSWSHTTRLFLRTSKLLDPRRGRGIYNTFPSKLSKLGFPLDHIFHSKHFKLGVFKVLTDIGSDHLPIFTELFLMPEVSTAGESDPPHSGDRDDLNTFKARGDKWDGPKEELDYS